MMKKTVLAASLAAVIASPAIASSYEMGYGVNKGGLTHDSVDTALSNTTEVRGSVEVSGLESVFDNFETDIQDKAQNLTLTQAEADAFAKKYSDGQIGALISIKTPFWMNQTDFGDYSLSVNYSQGYSAKTFESRRDLNLVNVNLGMDISSVESTEFALGLTANLDDDYGVHLIEDAKVSVGGKLRFATISANQYLFDFNQYVTGGNTNDEFDDALDSITSDRDSEQSLTLDVGGRIVTDNWAAGAVVKNLAPVKVNYQTFGGNMNVDTSYTLDTFAVLDGAYFDKGKNLTVGAYLETNEHTTLLNTEEQNAGAYLLVSPEWSWTPDFRFGYNKNLTGSELTVVSAGVSLGWFNFDVAASDFGYGGDNQEDFAGSASMSLTYNF